MGRVLKIMSGSGRVSDTHWALGGTTVYPPLRTRYAKQYSKSSLRLNLQNRLGGGWFLVMISKPAFVKANEERYWQKEKVAMAWLTVRD